MDNYSLFITILSGTSVASITYLIKQVFDFYFFNRWTEYWILRGRVLESAVFLSHFLTTIPSNPNAEVVKIWIEENQNVRRLAGNAVAFQSKRHAFLFGIPSKKQMKEVAEQLLGLAQCTRSHDHEKSRKHTKELLNILESNNGLINFFIKNKSKFY